MEKTIYWTLAIVAVGALGAVGVTTALLGVEEAEAKSCKHEPDRDPCVGCRHDGTSQGHTRTDGQCSHEGHEDHD